MKDFLYDFVDFDNVRSLNSLADHFGGHVNNKAAYFNNEIATGDICLFMPEPGIWIRKWNLTTFAKVLLRKFPAPASAETKLLLIYFLNPSIFSIKNNTKRIKIGSSHNNILSTSHHYMEFGVLPKQPFFVLDIAFTSSWLLDHCNDADTSIKQVLNQFTSNKPMLVGPSTVEEYKLLRELETSIHGNSSDILYIRSRIYCLIVNFLTKVINRDSSEVVQNTVHYEQIMRVERILAENMKELPKTETIAREVNLSVSTVLRQFKLIYKKGVHEYYLERKMELAKKMILERNNSIKDVAAMLGYRQSSPFIEAFTKHHGYSPGKLKQLIM